MIPFMLMLSLTCRVQVIPDGRSGVDIIYMQESESERSGLNLPGCSWLNHNGEPNLPSYVYDIGIPQEGGVEIKILENDEIKVADQDVQPVTPLNIDEPSAPASPIIKGPAYSISRFFPGNPVEVTEPRWFRYLNTVEIRLNPVRYNPVSREMLVSRRIKISIRFKSPPVVRPAADRSFETLYRKTIANYDQCRSWLRLPTAQMNNNPFASGYWYKITVAEEGLYRIGIDELRQAGLDPRQFDPRTMKIYTAAFDLLPRNVHTIFPDSLVEVPAYAAGEADGVFDRGDYLVFYGYPASHYQFDTTLVWFENGYARENVYWFTFGGLTGRRMTRILAPWDGTNPDTLVTEIAHIEEDKANPTRSGINWYWQDISPGGGSTGGTAFYISHWKAAGAARLTTGIYSIDSADGPFSYRISLNDNTFYNDTLTIGTRDTYPPIYLPGNGPVSGDSSYYSIEITRSSGVSGALTVYFNGLDLEYDRVTDFSRPFHGYFPSARTYSVRGRNANTQPFVLDITDPLDPRQLDSLGWQNRSLSFSYRSDSFQVLYFSQYSSAKPAVLVPRSPGRLRQNDPGCDYVFITHPDFYNALMPLVTYRDREYTTKVVTVDEIFDDFSFGKQDPLALKHFLYYTTNNWAAVPKYVLLVGDATYDYKNNLAKDNPPNFIPMYESGTTLSGNAGIPPNYIYDGECVNFDGAEAMILGRITVRTNAELRDFTDKLITYETQDIDGNWNKRILLTGDDEWADNYKWEGLIHCGSAESIGATLTDSIYDFAKVYMVSYPPFSYPCKKPNAQEAFIRELNKGAFAGLFFGHGNTHQLAHEGLFYDTKIPLIRNGRRYCFFYFASCTVGRFDDSDYECIGEELVRIKEGAIGTMAATSGTGGYENLQIGKILFSSLTAADTDLTMGESAFLAKSIYWSYHYVLFGDPATRMRKVTSRITLSHDPDSLRPLENMKAIASAKPFYLNAYLRDTTHVERYDSLTENKFSGHVWRMVQTGDFSFTLFDYRVYGREVFQGYWNQDTAQFVVPRIVTTNLPFIRLSTYKNGLSGMHDSIRVYGNAVPTSDNNGPAVAFYEAGRKLADGDWVDQEFTLTGKVSDLSGINFMNSKQDARGFYLYVNSDLLNRIDLRDYFIYDRNSYTAGEFNVRLTLPKSSDTITVNVADNNYNKTIQRLVLNAELNGQVQIENLLIYPNPVKDERGLWLTFNLSGSGVAEARLFTVAGRLLKTIAGTPANAGYNQLFWDGRDEYGDRLANGVYLVRVVVTNASGQDEVTEKFVIAR